MRRLVLFLLLLGLTACGRTIPTTETRPATAPTVAQKHRGLSYAAASPRRGTYGTESSAASLKNARALGVDWISVMPFGFQRNGASIAMGGWETPDSVRATIEQAHALEIKVLLKPHLWSREEIRYEDFSPQDWDPGSPTTRRSSSISQRSRGMRTRMPSASAMSSRRRRDMRNAGER